jgi:hypothetical protein
VASRDEHIRQAEHNEKLADTLSAGGSYPDWAVTIYFYAAIHYVNVILVAQGPVPTSHEKRDPLVRRHPNLSKIWNEYKALDIMSRNARYYCTLIENHILTRAHDHVTSPDRIRGRN